MSFNKNNLIKIPEKIVVGFQERTDTFTGKLAYVTLRDETGKLRKEASWESWRSKSIPSLELDNKPLNGFVINKGVQRAAGFSSGRSTIRIYHPLDFEFEIDVDNLTFLLMHSDVSKRDILQECILAWQGSSLVLLPVNCDEYKNAMAGEKAMSNAIAMNNQNFKPGQLVLDKKRLEYVYIGEYDWWGFELKGVLSNGNPGQSIVQKNMGKKHIFYDFAQKIFVFKEIKNLFIKEDLCTEFNDLLQEFTRCIHYQKIERIEVMQISEQDDPFCLRSDRLKNDPYLRRFEGLYPIYFDNNEIEIGQYLVDGDLGDYQNGSKLNIAKCLRAKYQSEASKFLIDYNLYTNPSRSNSNYNVNKNYDVFARDSKSLPQESLGDYFKRLYNEHSIGKAVFVMKDATKIPVKAMMFRFTQNKFITIL